jgi:hypothetical protein
MRFLLIKKQGSKSFVSHLKYTNLWIQGEGIFAIKGKDKQFLKQNKS